MAAATGTQVTVFVAGAGNATLATAVTAFNTAYAAAVAATQSGSVIVISSGLEVTGSSQSAAILLYQPWALVTYISA